MTLAAPTPAGPSQRPAGRGRGALFAATLAAQDSSRHPAATRQPQTGSPGRTAGEAAGPAARPAHGPAAAGSSTAGYPGRARGAAGGSDQASGSAAVGVGSAAGDAAAGSAATSAASTASALTGVDTLANGAADADSTDSKGEGAPEAQGAPAAPGADDGWALPDGAGGPSVGAATGEESGAAGRSAAAGTPTGSGTPLAGGSGTAAPSDTGGGTAATAATSDTGAGTAATAATSDTGAAAASSVAGTPAPAAPGLLVAGGGRPPVPGTQPVAGTMTSAVTPGLFTGGPGLAGASGTPGTSGALGLVGVVDGEDATTVGSTTPSQGTAVERTLTDGAVRPVDSLPATPRADAVARAEAPVPSAPAPPPPPVGSQVAAALARLKVAPDGHHVLNIRVDPEDLGPVRVSAHIGPEGVRIELFGVTDSARDALRGALAELRRDLAATGLQAELELGSRDRSADQSRSEDTAQPTGGLRGGPNRPELSPTRRPVPLGGTGLDLLA